VDKDNFHLIPINQILVANRLSRLCQKGRLVPQTQCSVL